MKTLRVYLLRHKYRLALYALVSAASLFCLVLVRLRLSENDGTHYTYYFIIRDLFLAWIPVLIALLAYGLVLPRKVLYAVIPLSVVIWLIFFPNALYLLTSFQHLRLYSDSPQIWFDVILVIWFAFTGLLLGLVSLHLMHRLVKRGFGRTAGWIFVCAAALLSSAGVYAGRFIRLNSWDIFNDPSGLFSRLVDQVSRSASRAAGFVSLYALFFIFMYITFYVFGNLLYEDTQEKP